MPRPVRCTLLIGKLGTAKPFWRLTGRRTLCTRRQKLPLTKPDCKSCRRSRCWMRSSQRKRTPPRKLRPDKRIPPRTLPVLGRCPRCFFVCIAKIYDWIFVKHELSLYSCYECLLPVYCKEDLCNTENGRMIVELYLGKQEHHVSRILY